MDNESEKIIADQVKKLPKEVRDALASDDLHKKIVAIGEKHHLHIDQIGLLEDEVTLVMMGMADPQELADTMATQMSLPKPDAEAVAAEVSQEIFLPIRDAMKKFTEGSSPSVVMPSAATTTPAPKPAPVPAPKPVTPTTPTPAPKPPEAHAELMLREATVSMPPKPAPLAPTVSTSTPSTPASAAKVETPKPVAPYKADPYREPPE